MNSLRYSIPCGIRPSLLTRFCTNNDRSLFLYVSKGDLRVFINGAATGKCFLRILIMKLDLDLVYL